MLSEFQEIFRINALFLCGYICLYIAFLQCIIFNLFLFEKKLLLEFCCFSLVITKLYRTCKLVVLIDLSVCFTKFGRWAYSECAACGSRILLFNFDSVLIVPWYVFALAKVKFIGLCLSIYIFFYKWWNVVICEHASRFLADLLHRFRFQSNNEAWFKAGSLLDVSWNLFHLSTIIFACWDFE